jgi:hypothetical protein
MPYRHDTAVHNVSQLTPPRKPPPLPLPLPLSTPPSSLRGMEIAVPPGLYPATPREDNRGTATRRNHQHYGGLDPEEYRKAAEWYANRPLPPLPLSKTPRRGRRPIAPPPPLNITRKVAVPISNADSPKTRTNNTMKPLPPPPPAFELPYNKPTSKRNSRSCPPTGHQPSHKAQQLMGCDIDIFDDTRTLYANLDPRFLEEEEGEDSSEYSQEADQIFDRSVSPMGNSCCSTRRVRFSDAGPPTPPSQPGSQLPSRAVSQEYRLEKPIRSAYEHFSDHKASSEYHKFTQELACDAGLSRSTRSASRSSGQGSSRPVMRRRGAGYPIPSTTPTDASEERPSSCFEHDDDENDDRGIPGAEVAAKFMTSMRGFLDKAKGKHSTKAAEKADRAERRREEDLKRSFKVVEGSGRRVT